MTRRRQIRRRTEPPERQEKPNAIRPWQWFLLAAAAPLAMCAARLNLDLWHDEIYTLLMFVAGGPAKIVTDYSAPNNHVLYSLLLWPIHLISSSNFVLRLPSLVFATGTLWLTFRAGCQLSDLRAGALATLLLGLNQMFLIHAVQVRGYGLSMLLLAWLVNLAIPGQRSVAFSRLALTALVGAAFLYVIPTDLLFFIPLAAVAIVWSVWPPSINGEATPTVANEQAAESRKVAAVCAAWMAGVALAAVLYAPIARQVLEHRGLPSKFTGAGLAAAARNFITPATHDFFPLAPFFLLGALAWALRRMRRKTNASAALPVMAAVVLCGAFLLTGALGISPFPRNFCPLLPVIALAEGWALGELAKSIRLKALASESASTLAAALLVAAVLAPQLWTYPSRLAAYCTAHPGAHDGYYNYYAADYCPAAVVERVKQLTADGGPFRVYFADEDHWNLIYYFQRAGQSVVGAETEAGDDPRAWVYVIAPATADWQAIAAKCKLPAEALREFPEIDNFGYYRLYSSRQLMKTARDH